MSTIAYLHRVGKNDFWDWADEVRAYYREHGLLGRLGRELGRQIAEQPDIDQAVTLMSSWSQARKKHADDLENLTVDLQLFDEGDTWLVRTLERGRGGARFAQIVAAHPHWPVEPVYYNDATDMPEGMAELRPVIDWMDEQINARRYLMFPVITVDDCDELVMELAMRRPADDDHSGPSDDRPDDRWQCTDCDYWATLIENAHHHATQTEHVLRPVGDANGADGDEYAGVRGYVTGQQRP